MRIHLIDKLIAPAVSLAMLISAAAQLSPPLAASASAAIQDGKAEVNGVLYHYLLAMGRGEPVILLHGWGSTSYMWRYVMPRLVDQGYTVLAPDLRGFGDTAKPASGYDKVTVANDIRALVAKLGLGPRVTVIGHDMGGMVTYAYAAQYPNEVSRLAILDVPLPGITPWDDIVRTKRTWHFGFFDVRDLPEMLIAGRERQFLAWFHNSEAVNSRAFTNEVGGDLCSRLQHAGRAPRRLRILPGFPNRRDRQQRLCQAEVDHAGARHRWLRQLRTDYR